MPSIAEALSEALAYQQAGQLPQAERLYRQILQAEPSHADAWNLLGVLAHQVGRHDVAIDYIGRAAALRPLVAEYHNNLGEAYRALGQLNDAVSSYRRAIELDPADAAAHS